MNRSFVRLSVGILGAWLALSGGALGQPASPAPPASPGGARLVVTDFGAVGDGQTDCATAFQSALDALAAAGRGDLHIPAGEYLLRRQISVEVTSLSATIRGDGVGATALLCDNTSGGLRIHSRTRESQITLTGLSAFAMRPGAGTALTVTQPEGGNRHNRTLIVRDVEMRSRVITRDYFDYGLVAWGQYRPIFENVIFAGPFGPGVDDKTSDSILFKAVCGIVADGSYAPRFLDCYVWSAQTGYRLRSEGKEARAPEDATFHRSFAVECVVGIDIYSPSIEPQLVIDACHINCRAVGIRIQGRKFFQIVNCLMYNIDKDRRFPNYVDIDLVNGQNGVISGNFFHFGGNPQRVFIQARSNSRDLIVANNQFNAPGEVIQCGDRFAGLVFDGNLITSPQARFDRKYLAPEMLVPAAMRPGAAPAAKAPARTDAP